MTSHNNTIGQSLVSTDQSLALTNESLSQVDTCSISSDDHQELERTTAQQYVNTDEHAFSRRKRNLCVCVASAAALLSPLASNVYLSATVKMSEEVGVPIHKITLTLTIYMVVQGVSPSFWGPLSDVKGRRLVFCCTLVLYLIANICLAVTRDYGSLAAFRALQAAGGAATIAICSGVIGDIASPAERGGMIGMSSAIRQAAQFLGPVAGGIITHYHGVRAIFCFLAMITSVVLLMVVVFLPETLPPIAGNGDVRLHGIHKPIMYAFKAQPDVFKEHSQMPSKPFTLSSLWTPICLLTQLDVFIVMFYGGIIYTIHNMVTASSTGLLQPRFKLTDVQTGLIFLPNGIGVIVGSFVWGNVLDRNWKTYDSKHESNDQELLEKKSGNGRFKPVHMERARLRHSWWLLLGFVASVCGYGFVLKAAHLAVVLVMQFCIAFTAQAVFAMCSTMSIDLFPQAAASVTGLQNLVRCTLGAAGVAVVDLMLERFGPGWTYSICAIVACATSPLLVFCWMRGASLREKRAQKLKEEERMGRGRETERVKVVLEVECEHAP